MRILFADDNYLSREISRCILESDGSYQIAAGGGDALKKVADGIKRGMHYDLIFLFDVLKGMDGKEVLEKIRSLETESGVKLRDASVVVMLTTHYDKNSYIANIYKECDYFLQLPVDRLKLALILETTKNDLELKLPKSA